jgi:hypothetical protein
VVPLHNDVLGAWELVSYTEGDNHGGPITYPLGPDALGLIMYTADGYMSAQIMRRDRPAFDCPETGRIDLGVAVTGFFDRLLTRLMTGGTSWAAEQ